MHDISLVQKPLLFRQITEFMDRFMLCAENHSATTLRLGAYSKAGVVASPIVFGDFDEC